MRTLRWTSMAAAAVIVSSAVLLSCKDESGCTKPCKLVAACKEKVKQGGDPMLGERAPPPDPACLRKCKTRPEEFAKCEAKKRTCVELRRCRGPFQ